MEAGKEEEEFSRWMGCRVERDGIGDLSDDKERSMNECKGTMKTNAFGKPARSFCRPMKKAGGYAWNRYWMDRRRRERFHRFR